MAHTFKHAESYDPRAIPLVTFLMETGRTGPSPSRAEIREWGSKLRGMGYKTVYMYNPKLKGARVHIYPMLETPEGGQKVLDFSKPLPEACTVHDLQAVLGKALRTIERLTQELETKVEEVNQLKLMRLPEMSPRVRQALAVFGE